MTPQTVNAVNLPLQNAHLQVHSAILAYARSLDVWGTSGKVDVVLPYAWLSGTADVAGQPRERVVSGLVDPRLRFSVRDAQGAEIYAWNSVLEQTTLKPGEHTWFKSRLASPPAEGKSIDVRFFNKRDIAGGSV